MLRMSAQEIETVISAYKQISKIPSMLGARLTGAGKSVWSQWSVRNLDRGQSTKFSCRYTVNDDLNVIAQSDFGTDVSNELLSAISPSERYRAVIREGGDAKEKKQFLEVWTANTLAHSVDLKALGLHGDVYSDSNFKTLEWSPYERCLVYIAEKKLAKSEPFIKRKPANEQPGDPGESAESKGEEHLYRQDWGEQLVGKHMSVIALFRLEDESVTVLKGLPESYCPGQLKWSPDGKSLVGVAWETEPRRLGLIFCTNRPSYVFSLTIDGKFSRISGSGQSVRSPRFLGDKLVWLQRKAGGPHHCCHQIVSANWPANETSEITTLVDIVEDEIATSNNFPFHGVYCDALPSRCYASGNRLVFSTQQKTTINSYILDIDTKQLTYISDKSFKGSLSILDVQADIIVASRSNLTHPSQLVMAQIPPKGKENEIKWKPISSRYELPLNVGGAVVEYLFLQHDNQDSFTKFNAIYVAPGVEQDRKLPLVLYLHGGPHSGFVDAFSLEAALFVSLGYAILLTNYRGSTGTGQKSIDFLIGKVGTSDVLDCKMAAEEAIKRYPISAKNIVLFGGSHGGFLVTYLSGLYPDFFNSVVSRNPVTDISSMFNSTDIPDWCAVEAGFDFTEVGEISEQQLLTMRRVSPMSHVHKVKAPTAVMLGSLDKRVPFYQGLEYHHRLKANGCVTRLFLYEDNHSLSSVPVEMDNLINSVLWFKKYMKDD